MTDADRTMSEGYRAALVKQLFIVQYGSVHRHSDAFVKSRMTDIDVFLTALEQHLIEIADAPVVST